MTFQPQAVLWDMDGTLVDTEPYWMHAETVLVESYGGTWSDDQALALIGKGLENSAVILQEAGVDLGVAEIVDHLTESVREQLVSRGLPFRPGARELLLSLREAGYKTALVTMSMRRMAEDVVKLLGFEGFDLVLGGDDVERPKPHPDPYLKAAERLAVNIEDTVALEDSRTGLTSAVASGAVALGIPNLLGLDDLGAHAIWPTLDGRDHTDIAQLFAEHRSPAVGAQENL
ncbi:HAD family hydrolase [Microbacterium sp. YY-01]|uniref:HAD family hydrolase n=1 Tax=Microbacterium sp. YY-01 TaxID=3421634 RepID=UPI003D16496E